MKFELNTTKDKLVGYLQVAERISRQNASRSTVPAIEVIHLEAAAEVAQLITELKTGQQELLKK